GRIARLVGPLEAVEHLIIGAAGVHSEDDTLIELAAAELRAIERAIRAEDHHALRAAIQRAVEVMQLGEAAPVPVHLEDDAGAIRSVLTEIAGATGARRPVDRPVRADQESTDRGLAQGPLAVAAARDERIEHVQDRVGAVGLDAEDVAAAA